MHFLLLTALTARMAFALMLHGQSDPLSKKCERQAASFLPADARSSIQASELLECYAAWHKATLKAWRDAGNSTGCKDRRARIVIVNRGLGDAGMNIMGHFNMALSESSVFMLDFELGAENVWSQAMIAPFSWNLRENLDLFCFTGEDDYTNWRSDNSDPEFVECRTCSDTVEKQAQSAEFTMPGETELLRFLYRPKPEVDTIVNGVMQKVSSNERFMAVHFRSEWTGAHFACGCVDNTVLGKCASNLDKYVASRGMSNFSSDRPMKIFVASDQLNGIGAFQRAFGEDAILALPDELPIQHSLESSSEGSIRIMADFMLLTKAEAMMGTCGSTFSALAQQYSGRAPEAFLTSGDTEAQACAQGAKDLDFSGFAFSSFSTGTEQDACGCYGDADKKAGTCTVACGDTSETLPVPSHCSKWQTSSLASARYLQQKQSRVCEWRTPLPRTIFAKKVSN